MIDELSQSNKNRSSNIKVVGLVADESNFGPVYDRERKRCFRGDYVGRKSLALSERPSAEWVRKFNKKFTSNKYLLQPLKKRIYILVANDYLWHLLQDLNEGIECINDSFTESAVEKIKKEEKESSAKYIRNYAEYLSGFDIPVIHKDGTVVN